MKSIMSKSCLLYCGSLTHLAQSMHVCHLPTLRQTYSRTACFMKILHGEHYFIFVVSIQPCMISVQTRLFIDCVIATELQAGL